MALGRMGKYSRPTKLATAGLAGGPEAIAGGNNEHVDIPRLSEQGCGRFARKPCGPIIIRDLPPGPCWGKTTTTSGWKSRNDLSGPFHPDLRGCGLKSAIIGPPDS